jgi:hypothetical protein
VSEPKSRYYIHGDCYEHNNYEYYCSVCDLFRNEAHFYEPHRVPNFARYTEALKFTKKVLPNSRQYYRPPAPPNLIARSVSFLEGSSEGVQGGLRVRRLFLR